MCQQNLPKLWCRYEFIVHNHLWNSEIVPQWIQQKISRKVTETDFQKLEFDNCKQQLFMLTMSLPACLWAHIARSPFNYTITARKLLEKCDDYQFLEMDSSVSSTRKNLSYCKHVYHNPSIRYASRCRAKRKWLYFFETNHFFKFVWIE